MDTEDRRVRRTKQRLHNALMSLIEERGYDKITVQDLIDRADVGRSTFYSHYQTKDDLLTSGLQHLSDDIELHMTGDPSANDILPSLGVFRHVADHHNLFKAMIGSRGIDLVMNAARDALTERAKSNIEQRSAAGGSEAIPADARAAFVAGSLMAFLSWWLDNDRPHPPDRMAEMFRQLTASA